MTADYTLTVGNVTSISDNILWNTTGTTTTSHYCGTWCSHWGYTYTYPTTIYKYQVKCPKCKKDNWLELDTVTPCTKCSSTLKAVSKKVDFEVEVD